MPGQIEETNPGHISFHMATASISLVYPICKFQVERKYISLPKQSCHLQFSLDQTLLLLSTLRLMYTLNFLYNNSLRKLSSRIPRQIEYVKRSSNKGYRIREHSR